MNKIKVAICGKEYTLQTAETSTFMYGLARNLEKKINAFTDAGASQLTAGVLVGLSLMDDLSKANDRNDNLIEEAKKYVDEAGTARIEKEAALKENADLKQKIAQLEKELEQIKKS